MSKKRHGTAAHGTDSDVEILDPPIKRQVKAPAFDLTAMMSERVPLAASRATAAAAPSSSSRPTPANTTPGPSSGSLIVPERFQSSEESSPPGQVPKKASKKDGKVKKKSKEKQEKKESKHDDDDIPDSDHSPLGGGGNDDDDEGSDSFQDLEGLGDLLNVGDDDKKGGRKTAKKRPASKRVPNKKPAKRTEDLEQVESQLPFQHMIEGVGCMPKEVPKETPLPDVPEPEPRSDLEVAAPECGQVGLGYDYPTQVYDMLDPFEQGVPEVMKDDDSLIAATEWDPLSPTDSIFPDNQLGLYDELDTGLGSPNAHQLGSPNVGAKALLRRLEAHADLSPLLAAIHHEIEDPEPQKSDGAADVAQTPLDHATKAIEIFPSPPKVPKVVPMEEKPTSPEVLQIVPVEETPTLRLEIPKGVPVLRVVPTPVKASKRLSRATRKPKEKKPKAKAQKTKPRTKGNAKGKKAKVSKACKKKTPLDDVAQKMHSVYSSAHHQAKAQGLSKEMCAQVAREARVMWAEKEGPQDHPAVIRILKSTPA